MTKKQLYGKLYKMVKEMRELSDSIHDAGIEDVLANIREISETVSEEYGNKRTEKSQEEWGDIDSRISSSADYADLLLDALDENFATAIANLEELAQELEGEG